MKILRQGGNRTCLKAFELKARYHIPIKAGIRPGRDNHRAETKISSGMTNPHSSRGTRGDYHAFQ